MRWKVFFAMVSFYSWGKNPPMITSFFIIYSHNWNWLIIEDSLQITISSIFHLCDGTMALFLVVTLTHSPLGILAKNSLWSQLIYFLVTVWLPRAKTAQNTIYISSPIYMLPSVPAAKYQLPKLSIHRKQNSLFFTLISLLF